MLVSSLALKEKIKGDADIYKNKITSESAAEVLIYCIFDTYATGVDGNIISKNADPPATQLA